MPQTNKTPAGVAGHAGASRKCCEGRLHPSSTVETYRAQFLTLAYAIRPETAAMLAALVLAPVSGGGNG